MTPTEKLQEVQREKGPKTALTALRENIENKGFNFEVFFKRVERFSEEVSGSLSKLFGKIKDAFGLKQEEFEAFIPKQEAGKEKKVSYSSLRNVLNKNPNWELHANRASRDFNVPSSVIFAVIRQESGFNTNANSPFTSAKGLAQATDKTWHDFLKSPENKHFKEKYYKVSPGNLIDSRFNPEAAIYFVAWYARHLANIIGIKNITPGVAKDIAIAYHSGPNGYQRWKKYQETGNRDTLLTFQKRPEINFNGKTWKSYEEEVTDYASAVPQYAYMYQQQLIA